MKKLNFSLYVFVILNLLLCSCGSLSNSTATSSNKVILGISSLPAVELAAKDSYIPTNGISLDNAKDIIFKYISSVDPKADISNAMEVEDITTKECWDNLGVQLYSYSVPSEHNFINGIALLKDGFVLHLINTFSTDSIFLADLDSDQKYEIYTISTIGSGIVRSIVTGYNLTTKQTYSLSSMMDGGKKLGNLTFELFINNRQLYLKKIDHSTDFISPKKYILAIIDEKLQCIP